MVNLLAGKAPIKISIQTNLKHPPFTFHLNAFKPGSLTAIGYINKKSIEEVRKTPGAPAKINLRVDVSGKELKACENDIVFVYADITDNNGTVIYNATNKIEFKVSGDAEIVSPSNVQAEAGIATIVLKAGEKSGKIIITAQSNGLKSSEMVINSKL